MKVNGNEKLLPGQHTHLALDGGGELGRVGLASAELQQRLGQLAVADAQELRERIGFSRCARGLWWYEYWLHDFNASDSY